MTPIQPPSDISNDAIADALRKQADAILLLTKELASLRDQLSRNEKKIADNVAIIPPSLWETSPSLKRSINDHENDLLKSFAWRENTSFQDLLTGRRLWLSPGYRLAYPTLSNFLSKAKLDEATRSKVLIRDSVKVWNSTSGLLKLESLWGAISKRGSFGTDPKARPKASARTVFVTDMSPTVAAMILESSPRIDLNVIAPALDRHLTRSNYGLVKFYHHTSKDFPGMNAYTFEYQIATFYIPKALESLGKVFQDFRGLRKSSKFGPDVSEPSRWIHEEQLSFILTGHGCDVFTCYQLADRYFADPTKSDPVFQSSVFNAIGEGATPSVLFLSWLGRALNHVVRRWDLAIGAIDSHINETFQIIFSETNPDLLSDDPQFSRSKTYFWALQAYKLFDESITATLEAWDSFNEYDCEKLCESQDDSSWKGAMTVIQLKIDRLKEQRTHIRKRVEEVQDLRAGLFGASALFDSRTSLRQNDNIRLLTYVTLLFLPLSFGTSIFGMQVILPSLPIKVFIITLPSIFVFTALLIFNLQNMIDLWDVVMERATAGMRHIMQFYGHPGWPETSSALENDRIIHQVPVQKIVRQSTHWAYLAFALESPFVLLPVHEVSWLLSQIARLLRNKDALIASSRLISSNRDEKGASRATRVKIVEEAREDARQQRDPWYTPLRLMQLLLTIIRMIAMPLWILFAFADYAVLLLYFTVRGPPVPPTPPPQPQSQKATPTPTPTPPTLLLRPIIWLRLDGAFMETGWMAKREEKSKEDGSSAVGRWKRLDHHRLTSYRKDVPEAERKAVLDKWKVGS